MADFYVPETVLSIAAHPDDIEFSCAGTLARWAKNGSHVIYVLCTSGDAGIEIPYDEKIIPEKEKIKKDYDFFDKVMEGIKKNG